MSEIKLLPCPFCGGEAEIILQYIRNEDVVTTGKQVKCKQCFVKTAVVFTQEQAIENWNTRKPMQEIVEKLEEYGSIWVQYQEIMTKEEIAESVLKQAKEQCIRIVKEVGGMND